MQINFSHTVKAETVAVLTFGRERAERQAQIHAIGCAHASKADHVGAPQDAATLVRETETVYRDDYYHVAPCARRA